MRENKLSLIKNKISLLVIHCSDTPDDKHLTGIDIHRMHLNFGWDGVGYHKIIQRDGTVENGRPEYWIGAHAKGINSISLGVCLIGREHFTKKQFKSLKLILLDWRSRFPKTKITGHCNAIKTDKTCPNFDVNKWCESENIVINNLTCT